MPWLVGGGILGLALLSIKKAGARLNFFPGAITSFGFDGITPLVKFSIRVQNVSNTAFQLTGLAANVYANEVLIGNVSNFTVVTIPATSEQIVILTARLSALPIVSQLVQMITTKSGTMTLQIQGTANVSGYVIPLNLKFGVNK